MADVTERVTEARDHVAPAWTPERERSLRARLELRVEKAKRRRVGALAVAAFVLFLAGAVVWSRSTHRARVATTEAAPTEVVARELLRLEDGTLVTALSADAQVEPIEIGSRAVASRLVRGAARFSVTRNPERVFRVLAHDVTITVLGTVFDVSLETGGVRVAVGRGRVRVAWPSGERDLDVGEQMLVSEESAPASASSGPASPPAEAAATSQANAAETTRSASRSAVGPSWRSLAEDGEYARAFARMSVEGPNAVRDEPGDLLLAADVARLSGHPENAVHDLERVVGSHADDSRAPLAAFTLGRTLLDQLGRPREAAQAFATARRLEPHGALAQDALAREVESWSHAGETSLTRERADEYIESYPNGRRLAAVKRLSGEDGDSR